jgi:hypothetical protein
MAMGTAVGLATGSIVELDAGREEPVDVYVNGLVFARGRLVRSEADEWAVRIEELLAGALPSVLARGVPPAVPEPDGGAPHRA